MKQIKKIGLHKLKGQSLIEAILAVALLAIIASSLSVYLNNQLVYMTRGQSTLEAIYLAQEGLEASRSVRDINWDLLATGTHGLIYNGVWNFFGNEEIIGQFTRTILVSDISENERSVISTVMWPGMTTMRTIALATNLSNWRNVGDDTIYISKCIYITDKDFYIPLKQSSSGDYPTFGSSSDQVTLNSSNNSSTGYVNVNFNFSNIPTGFTDAVLHIDFEDLDLQVDQFNISGSIVTLQEAFSLFDVNSNLLTSLDETHPDDGEFTWQTFIPNYLIAGSSLTLKTRLSSELNLLSGGLTVTNSLDGMSNIQLCGSVPIDSPVLSGDWGNPVTLGTIDLGPGNTPTDLAVKNGMVYLSAQASSAAKPDFFIIDATNGISPVVKGQINTSIGLNGVDILGNFAYLANQDTANHLQIANISDPSNPYLISSYRLSGNTHQATAIAVTGTVAFVGTALDSGREFFAVNVATPSSPVVYKSLEIGGTINKIYILGDKAYLATSNDNSEVVIVDISNPANPNIVKSIDLPNTNDALGINVNYQDSRMYVSRKISSNSNSPEAMIYDVSDVNNPVQLGALEFSSDIYSAYGADNLMFLATAYSSQEFNIYKAADPGNLIYWTGINFPQLAVDMVLENNMIYMAIRSNDALRIITSQ